MAMKIWCDRCGKEFAGNGQNTARTDGRFVVGTHVLAGIGDVPYPDLCAECQQEIVANGTPYDFEKEAAEATQPNTCTP